MADPNQNLGVDDPDNNHLDEDRDVQAPEGIDSRIPNSDLQDPQIGNSQNPNENSNLDIMDNEDDDDNAGSGIDVEGLLDDEADKVLADLRDQKAKNNDNNGPKVRKSLRLKKPSFKDLFNEYKHDFNVLIEKLKEKQVAVPAATTKDLAAMIFCATLNIGDENDLLFSKWVKADIILSINDFISAGDDLDYENWLKNIRKIHINKTGTWKYHSKLMGKISSKIAPRRLNLGDLRFTEQDFKGVTGKKRNLQDRSDPKPKRVKIPKVNDTTIPDIDNESVVSSKSMPNSFGGFVNPKPKSVSKPRSRYGNVIFSNSKSSYYVTQDGTRKKIVFKDPNDEKEYTKGFGLECDRVSADLVPNNFFIVKLISYCKKMKIDRNTAYQFITKNEKNFTTQAQTVKFVNAWTKKLNDSKGNQPRWTLKHVKNRFNNWDDLGTDDSKMEDVGSDEDAGPSGRDDLGLEDIIDDNNKHSNNIIDTFDKNQKMYILGQPGIGKSTVVPLDDYSGGSFGISGDNGTNNVKKIYNAKVVKAIVDEHNLDMATYLWILNMDKRSIHQELSGYSITLNRDFMFNLHSNIGKMKRIAIPLSKPKFRSDIWVDFKVQLKKVLLHFLLFTNTEKFPSNAEMVADSIARRKWRIILENLRSHKYNYIDNKIRVNSKTAKFLVGDADLGQNSFSYESPIGKIGALRKLINENYFQSNWWQIREEKIARKGPILLVPTKEQVYADVFASLEPGTRDFVVKATLDANPKKTEEDIEKGKVMPAPDCCGPIIIACAVGAAGAYWLSHETDVVNALRDVIRVQAHWTLIMPTQNSDWITKSAFFKAKREACDSFVTRICEGKKLVDICEQCKHAIAIRAPQIEIGMRKAEAAKPKEKKSFQKKSRKDIICYACRKKGHIASRCPEKE